MGVAVSTVSCTYLRRRPGQGTDLAAAKLSPWSDAPARGARRVLRPQPQRSAGHTAQSLRSFSQRRVSFLRDDIEIYHFRGIVLSQYQGKNSVQTRTENAPGHDLPLRDRVEGRVHIQRVNRRCREVSGAAGLSILKPAVQQQQRAGTCATRTTDILSPDTCLRRRWMPGWS